MSLLESRHRRHRFALAAVTLAATLAAGSATAGPTANSPWCVERCDEVVLDWNATAHQVIKAADGYQNPLAASRALAMMHLAMHDALNAVTPHYATWSLVAAARDADPALAAVTAAHDALLALYPAQKDLLRANLDKSALDAGSGRAAQRGAELGHAIGAAVIARRSADGSTGREPYREGRKAGEYRFVPASDALFAPHWRQLTPFALRSPQQFRVAAPPALGSAHYTRDFLEVKDNGGKSSTARTTEQTHYAAFWYEFSEAGWNRVARVVSRGQPQDLWQRARTFALLNVAMADAYIAGWDSKLHHDFWRPVTAIRLAADDGNPSTQPDAQWESMLPTPPIQDHPSTHSALGAAAAAVLAHCFKRDDVKFTFASPTALADNPMRSLGSFSAAAYENADSRVRAGLHFRSATIEGLRLGRRVGGHAVATLLTPAY